MTTRGERTTELAAYIRKRASENGADEPNRYAEVLTWILAGTLAANEELAARISVLEGRNP